MATLDETLNWVGKKMVDTDGDKIGTIGTIYLDRATGKPEWATVKTGLIGTKHHFVPIQDAQPVGDDEVRVSFQKDQVKNSPTVKEDSDLSTGEERRLYEHYGRTDYADWQGEDRSQGIGLPDDDAQPAGEPGAQVVRLRRVIVVATRPPAS
jgi:hypothetical protein